MIGRKAIALAPAYCASWFHSGSKDGPALLLPILLDARGAQASEAMLIDRILPGEELLDRQRIAAAGLLKREQAAAHSGDDLGLAADDPALGAGRGQIGDRQRASIRPNDVFGPWSKGLIHEATHALD